jgi:hypothetical protein
VKLVKDNLSIPARLCFPADRTGHSQASLSNHGTIHYDLEHSLLGNAMRNHQHKTIKLTFFPYRLCFH